MVKLSDGQYACPVYVPLTALMLDVVDMAPITVVDAGIREEPVGKPIVSNFISYTEK